MSLTPAERTLRAKLAAHTLHSLYDSRDLTAKARAASPASLGYWERQVDPDGVLSVVERERRAAQARSAHFARMALRSAQARRRRVEAS